MYWFMPANTGDDDAGSNQPARTAAVPLKSFGKSKPALPQRLIRSSQTLVEVGNGSEVGDLLSKTTPELPMSKEETTL
ncbi:unnamed protein product [Peniophora sp. CBMAI 1063]|nr:unnamed protein product [Peniophora sp. CBMAI 1063]